MPPALEDFLPEFCIVDRNLAILEVDVRFQNILALTKYLCFEI